MPYSNLFVCCMFVLACLILCDARVKRVEYKVDSFIGGYGTKSESKLEYTPFKSLTELIVEPLTGDIFVGDDTLIRKIDLNTRTVSIFAGLFGVPGSLFNVTASNNAVLMSVSGMAFHPITNDLYVADKIGKRVIKIDRKSGLVTVAVNSFAVLSVAFDSDGILYISENTYVRKVFPDGSTSIVASKLSYSKITIHKNVLYVIEPFYNCIKVKETKASTFKTLAGSCGTSGSANGYGYNSRLNSPQSLKFLPNSDDFLILDVGNKKIRKYDAITTYVSTYAGIDVLTIGYGGDDSLATFSSMGGFDVVNGSVYLTSGGIYIRQVLNNIVYPFSGKGNAIGVERQYANMDNKLMDLIIEKNGDVYIGTNFDIMKMTNNVIEKLLSSEGSSFEDGPVSQFKVISPQGFLNKDLNNNLMYAELSSGITNKLRIVLNDTTVKTIAQGNMIYNGDKILAITALVEPDAIAIHPITGEIYFTDQHLVRKISNNLVETVSGQVDSNMASSGNGGLAINAVLNHPHQLSFFPNGDLLVSTRAESPNTLRIIYTNGIIDEYNVGYSYYDTYIDVSAMVMALGSGDVVIQYNSGIYQYTYSTGVMDLLFSVSARSVTSDTENNIFVGIIGAIKKYQPFDSNGKIILGGGTILPTDIPSNGTYPLSVKVIEPVSMLWKAGELWYVDSKTILCLKSDGKVYKVFGNNVLNPTDFAISDTGIIYFCDKQTNGAIMKLERNSTDPTIIVGRYGDGGLATASFINTMTGAVQTKSGNIYIASSTAIRKVTLDGVIHTIAGNGRNTGDFVPAIDSQIIDVLGITADEEENIYFSDRSLNLIRMINSSSGLIKTIAGTGVFGYSGDGGFATNATISNPRDIHVTKKKDIYFTTVYGIRKISNGIITTLAGSNTIGNKEGLASEARFGDLSGLFVKEGPVYDEVYVCEEKRGIIKRVYPYNVCEDGYYGTNCEFYCYNELSNCSSHGTCTGPEQCSCSTGYYGQVCDMYQCFGVDFNSTFVCSGTGVCNLPDSCQCSKGYSGFDCSQFYCFGFEHNNTQVCQANGTCEKPDACSCKEGYYGFDCGLYNCYGYEMNNSRVCSGNGVCVSVNNCSCLVGFLGQDCSQYYCLGILKDNVSVCSGAGICASADMCVCNSTNYGNDCEIKKCNGKLVNDSTVCSSNGYCLNGQCVCNSTYYGIDCEIKKCNGKLINDSTVCSSNGLCLNGQCVCNSTNYGIDCEIKKCNGKLINDSNVCSANGYCLNGQCVCNSTYYGIDCEIKKCNGKLINDSNVCSSNGLCLNGQCVCNSTNYGIDCEIKKCNGKLVNDSTVCSLSGQCLNGLCVCNSTTYGIDCEIKKCNGKLINDSNVCSSNGLCLNGQCVCNSTNYGNDCEIKKCNGKLINDSNVCSSNGLCLNGQCVCNSINYGIDCEIKKCNGKLINDSNVCSSNGYCLNGQCVCNSTNYGIDCEIKKCNGKLINDSTVCSSNGLCLNGQCVCNSTYFGIDCSNLTAINSTINNTNYVHDNYTLGENITNNIPDNGTLSSNISISNQTLNETLTSNTTNITNNNNTHENTTFQNTTLSSNISNMIENNTMNVNDTTVQNATILGNSTINENSTLLNGTQYENKTSLISNNTMDIDNTTTANNTSFDHNITVVDNSTNTILNETLVSNITVNNTLIFENTTLQDINNTKPDNISFNNTTSIYKNSTIMPNATSNNTMNGSLNSNTSLVSSNETFNETIVNSTTISNHSLLDNGTLFSNMSLGDVNQTLNETSTTNTSITSINTLTNDTHFSNISLTPLNETLNETNVENSTTINHSQVNSTISNNDNFTLGENTTLHNNSVNAVENTTAIPDNGTLSISNQTLNETTSNTTNILDFNNTHENTTFQNTTLCSNISNMVENNTLNSNFTFTFVNQCFGKLHNDSNVCSANGECLDGMCVCNSSSYGPNCQFKMCNGKLLNDSTICSAVGKCLNGICVCDNSSVYGEDCQHLKCFLKQADNPTVCSSHGSCVGGLCVCEEGYFGKECQTHSCNGIPFHSKDTVCSNGRGRCISMNNCSCEIGFYGDWCEKVKPSPINCYGIPNFSPITCSLHGTCSSNDNCTCDSGYTGFDCKNPICFEVSSTSESVCSGGKGKCTKPDQCSCVDGYTGSKCQTPICFGTEGSNSSVCSGNGYCADVDNCHCSPGYGGNKCQYPTCFGIIASDPKVCSGYGNCIAKDTCLCIPSQNGNNVKVAGLECEKILCGFGKGSPFYLSTDKRVCNGGKGTCYIDKNTGTGGCNCSLGYSGEYCQLYTCNNILFSETRSTEAVCSGHGSCVDFNKCECKQNQVDGFWQGTNCQECSPNYESRDTGCKKLTCDPLTTCNNHGICNSTLQCVCNANWDGTFCNHCLPNYFGSSCDKFCEKSITCSGHGTCNNDATCSCSSNRKEGFWKNKNCNECQNGYHGSMCSTQILGPAKFLDMYNGITLKLFAPKSYILSSVNCAELISTEHLNLFGKNPICSWTNKETGEFSILFGEDYTLRRNTVINMNRLVFETSGSDLEYIKILDADNQVQPIVILGGNKEISSCDYIQIDGSKSYSGDRKSLIYHWSIVSSPNNISFSIPKTSDSVSITQASQPGIYHFTLKVESSMSGMISDEVDWFVTKSNIPLPQISILGFSEITVTTSSVPIIIKKIVDLPSCYYTDQNMQINWEQISGPSVQFEKDTNNNLVITKFYTLGESYEFLVTAISKTNSLSRASTRVKINTISSPMRLNIFTSDVTADSAVVEVEFNDPEKSLEPQTFKWSCTDVTNDGDCGSVISSILIQNQNKKSIILPSTDFKSIQGIRPSLKIDLEVIKGSRRANAYTELVFPENANMVSPTVNLISVIPSKSTILKTEMVNLQLSVTVNGLSLGIDSFITRVWTLNSIILKTGNPVISKMATPPSNSNSIVIDPTTLEEGSTYQLMLTVTDNRNKLTASYTHKFTINKSPQSCPCSISPSSGIALETNFSFLCTNCQNTEKSLQIIYGFVDDKSGANIPLYFLGELFSTKLPCSYTPLTNNIVSTFIRIVDTSTGAFTEIKKDIVIELPTAKSVNEIKRKVANWNELVSNNGDTSKLVFNSATISRTSEGMISRLHGIKSSRNINCQNGGVLNSGGRCICPTGFLKKDCSLTQSVFNDYISIRIDLMDRFIKTFQSRNPFEPIKETYLTLQAYGLDSLIEKYDELDNEAMEKSFAIFETLLGNCIDNKNLKVPFGVEKLLTGILNSVYNYLVYNSAPGENIKIERLIQMLKNVGELLLRDGYIGESDIVLETDFGTLSTNRYFKSSYSSLEIQNEQHKIQLPIEMPKYILEKSNRIPISFISLSMPDLFDLESGLGKTTVLLNDTIIGESTITSTQVRSKKVLRSKLLSLEILESPIESLKEPILYRFNLSHPVNPESFKEKGSTLPESTGNKILSSGQYPRSEFSCMVLSNTTMSSETLCVLEELQSNYAVCKCSNLVSVVLVEEILEKELLVQQRVQQSESSFITITVIVVSSIAFIFILICVAIIGLAIVIYCKRRKRKVAQQYVYYDKSIELRNNSWQDLFVKTNDNVSSEDINSSQYDDTPYSLSKKLNFSNTWV